MNFFAHQEQARRQSRKLFLLFALAVIAIIAAVDLVAVVVFSQAGDLETQPSSSDPLMIILITSAVTGCVILIASLTRMAGLRSGGAKVARSLGGTQINARSSDPLHRRLRNVVEEIALAAGMPVPDIFVLEGESGINAFAAGFTPSDAAIAVTNGALEQLSRDELQGVIAHEFSHILNGDMRLNLRLMGVLFGILMLSILGQRLLFATSYGRSSRSREGGGIVFVALAVVIVGYVGLFFGRLIKASVSRQREFLADASAVQFTRSPSGIANALKKIGGATEHGVLQDPGVEEVSHMLFASGLRRSLSGMLATHPPLAERIRRIEPGYRSESGVQPTLSGSAGNSVTAGFAGADIASDSPLQKMISRSGRLGKAELALGIEAHDAVDDDLLHQTHAREQATAMVCSLLLSADSQTRKRQLDMIELKDDSDELERVKALYQRIKTIPPEARFSLLELVFPALKARPARELRQLLSLIDQLIRADGIIEIYEYAVSRLIRVLVGDALAPDKPAKPCKLDQARIELSELFAVLAQTGNPSPEAARAAYEAGLSTLLPMHRPAFSTPQNWVQALDRSLDRLAGLPPLICEGLVQALATTITHDRRVTHQESTLFRAICGSLHVPLPPLETAGVMARSHGPADAD